MPLRFFALVKSCVVSIDSAVIVLPQRRCSIADHSHWRPPLGTLPYEELARQVPAAVWEQLQKTNDDNAYRRYAELFQHLGLMDSLRELSERALRSTDSAVREVGEDFIR